MSLNKKIKYHKLNLSDKINKSYISKKKKIQEEIKEYVIDRFINIIYKQNKEILQLKEKLEEITKNSILILKKGLQWKNFFCVNQIKLSYINGLSHINNGNNENSISTIGSNSNLEKEKSNEKSEKGYNNSVKPFINIDPLKLKKFLNLKISSNQKNKINYLNKNNLNIKYNNSLNIVNDILKNKHKTRNNFYKDLTISSEGQFETFFSNKKYNHKIEPIKNYNTEKNISINSLEQKEKNNKYTNNRIHSKNIFFNENNIENGKPKRLNEINQKEEKINLLNQKNYKKNNNFKRNTTGNFSSLKKINLNNNFTKNNPNINRNITNYCSTEINYKYKEKIKDFFSDKKKISSYSQNQKNIKNINNNNIANDNNNLINNKISGINKLNKIILRMKEIRKNIYSSDLCNLSENAGKVRKKINCNDMNKFNTIKSTSKTEKFLKNYKSFNDHKYNEKDNIKKNYKYYIEKKRRENTEIINENDNSLMTIYNPTFISFLNRKKTKDNKSEEKYN